MIKALRVSNFRGIRDAHLDDLPKVAVLMGPNGCGKSTLLEAMLIGGSNDVGDAVGRVVKRRLELTRGARWLYWNGDTANRDAPPTIHTSWQDQVARTVNLLHAKGSNPHLDKLARDGQVRDLTAFDHVRATARQGAESMEWLVDWDTSNDYRSHRAQGQWSKSRPFLRLLDQRIGSPRSPSHKAYTECRQRGGTEAAKQLIHELVPDLIDVEILTDEDNAPYLALSQQGRSVPVALAGDGMESIVRLALEMSAPKPGTLLIEEPEAHQHYGAMSRTARLLAAAAKQGTQLVISTHSLELLDMLLAEIENLDDLAVLRLRLDNGQLTCVRVPGKEASRARAEFAHDLR